MCGSFVVCSLDDWNLKLGLVVTCLGRQPLIWWAMLFFQTVYVWIVAFFVAWRYRQTEPYMSDKLNHRNTYKFAFRRRANYNNLYEHIIRACLYLEISWHQLEWTFSLMAQIVLSLVVDALELMCQWSFVAAYISNRFPQTCSY